MKKIIRGILLGLLAVIVIGGSVGAYMLFGGKGPEVEKKPTVVDANGNTYLAVVDGDSKETMVAVTDKDGNVYAVVTDKDGNLSSTVGNISDKVNKNDLPTNYTGSDFNITNTKNYSGNVVSDAQTTAVPASTKNNGGSTTTTKAQQQKDELKPYRIAYYRDNIFSGGTYLMEFTTNDETMNDSIGDSPLTMATKNNNVYVSTKFQSLNCEMLMLAPTSSKKDAKPTIYLILDKFKIYCKMPEDTVGDDLNVGGAMKDFGSEIKDSDITVSKVSIDGKELICESYVSEKDGATIKYFFDGETLVRRDDVDKDGKVNSLYISKLTNEVPDSLFEIPKNYRYLNMSLLEKLGGAE